MSTVPDLIIDHAKAKGLNHFFGLPSSGVLLHMMDAGRRKGVDFVATAHESSGAIAAAYYGYFKGCAGLAIAIQGVGAGNMVSGAITVGYERKPVVCVCECPALNDFGQWGQQGDHPGMFTSTAKACYRIDGQNTAQVINDAFRLAAKPRKGPVLVELPRDLGKVEAKMELTNCEDPAAKDPDPRELDAAIDFIASLRKPVIIAGDDIRTEGCLGELYSTVESLRAAVLVTMDGRGVFPETSERFGCVFIGTAPRHALYRRFIEESDGVLIIGREFTY